MRNRNSHKNHVLPCKRKRCILLAVCTNKSHITCNLLHEYYGEFFDSKTTKRYTLGSRTLRESTPADLWKKHIKKYFPNLISLSPETKGKTWRQGH